MAESTDEVSSPELNPEPVVNPGATTEATPTDQAGQRAAYRAVLQNPNVRTLAASKAFNKMAIAALTYGAMVHLAGIGAPQFQISSVSASSTVAAVLFGFQGGTAADTMPKRIAIAGGHGLLAITCFLVPSLFGTGVGQLMLLIFLTSLIMQVVGPGLSAAVALVANPRDLATASAIVSIGGYAAAGVGSALIAPTLIKLTGIDVVIYVAGALYALGAIRALKLPQEEQPSSARSLRDVDWKPQALSLRRTSGLIVQYRALATMILISAIAVALTEAFNALLPLYVANVLHENPANSVYIFAPAGIGLLVGTLIAPRLIAKVGERRVATSSVVLMCGGMVLLGLIDVVAPVLAPISPLRVVELLGVSLNDRVLAASVISIPLNFGSTSCGASVTNFINRLVPVVNQGATFGLQEVQKNLLSLVAVITLGGIADIVGAQPVMVIAPVFVVGLVLWLLRYSYRYVLHTRLSPREAWELLRTEPSES